MTSRSSAHCVPLCANALYYIILVLLLIAVFGPGMAILLDPVVAIIAALCLLALLGQAPGANAEVGTE